MSKKVSVTIYIVLVLLAIFDFCFGLHWALLYPGIDERIRIAGARLLLNHIDAYPFPGYEPNPVYRLFSWNTYTPALLMLYAPLRWWRYETQRLLFFVFDWVCLVSLFFLSRVWWKPADRAIHAAAFSVFVLADYGILLHMERGQYYIFVAVLIAVAIVSWSKARMQTAGALAAGVLLTIRPTFLIVLPALWFVRCRSQVVRTVAVAGLLLAALLFAFGLQPWRDYTKTVQMLQQETQAGPFVSKSDTPLSSATAPDMRGYTRVEGQDFSKQMETHYFTDRAFMRLSALRGVRRYTVRLFRTASIFGKVNTLLLALTAIYSLWLAYLLRGEASELKLGFAFLTPTLIECFAPTRHAYSDITVAPALLVIAAILTARRDLLREFRVSLLTLVTICVFSYAGGLFLNPEGTLLGLLSLSRWFASLVFVNWFFLRDGLRTARIKNQIVYPTDFDSSVRLPTNGSAAQSSRG